MTDSEALKIVWNLASAAAVPREFQDRVTKALYQVENIRLTESEEGPDPRLVLDGGRAADILLRAFGVMDQPVRDILRVSVHADYNDQPPFIRLDIALQREVAERLESSLRSNTEKLEALLPAEQPEKRT